MAKAEKDDLCGWNVGNIHMLRDSLDAVIEKHGQDREQIIQVIAAWWGDDKNALPRKTQQTANKQAEILARKMAVMGNQSAWANAVRAELYRGGDYEAVDYDFIGTVLTEAPASQPAWDALKEWARYELAQGRSLPLEAQRVLIGQEPPKGKKSAKVANQIQGQQVAAIISALKEKTIFKSHSNNQESPARSALVIVEEATKNRVTVSAAYRIWEVEKGQFEGELPDWLKLD